MSVKERLIKFIASNGISQGQFEVFCKISNGYVNNIRRSIGPDIIKKIEDKFPDLNIMWLLHDIGPMRKSKEVQEKLSGKTRQKEPKMKEVPESITETSVRAVIENNKILCDAQLLAMQNQKLALETNAAMAASQASIAASLQALTNDSTVSNSEESRKGDASMIRVLRDLVLDIGLKSNVWPTIEEGQKRMNILVAADLSKTVAKGNRVDEGK